MALAVMGTVFLMAFLGSWVYFLTFCWGPRFFTGCTFFWMPTRAV